jgi:DnaJ family protein C protein 28
MSSVEEHIRQAMQEGKFDNLPGVGKPLRLDDNPNGDPEWQLAYHLLQSSGFTLPWIERRNELEEELQAARGALQRSWAWRVNEASRAGSALEVEIEWQRACSRFRKTIEVLNKKILTYNLEAPSERFQMRLVNADRELGLTALPPSDTLAGTDTG